VFSHQNVKTKRKLVAIPRVGREGGRDGRREGDVGGVQDELPGGEAVEEDEEGTEEGEEVGLVEPRREKGRGADVQLLGAGEDLGEGEGGGKGRKGGEDVIYKD